jgi:mannose-1-phosphate guanylyltransferase/mannose-6-phosphate isomerase
MRCLEVSDISEIFVVTNDSQRFFVTGQAKELGHDLPPENVLIEPEPKNTLPAISFGMREIIKRFGKSIVGVFSSDHVLDIRAMETIKNAQLLATEHLVTFGIVPTSPHTGYGYIKPAEKIGVGYKVAEFREKPNYDDALKYLKEECLWNSGMFLFDTDVFFRELQEQEKTFFKAFDPEINPDATIEEIYGKVRAISIDYGIMEKSRNVVVVRLEHKWSDLGNFNAIYEESEKDDNGNVIYECEDILINSRNNLVYSKCDKLVALIDVENMAVVDTPDALLVCPRNSSQKVKQVADALHSKNDERAYLQQTVYRPWGSYTVMEKSDRHKIKNITVEPKKKLSLQLHYHRSEHWIVVKGMATVQINDETFFLRQGESTFIRAGMRHRLANEGKLSLEIIEVQLGECVDEDDIVRFDDDYGRVRHE